MGDPEKRMKELEEQLKRAKTPQEVERIVSEMERLEKQIERKKPSDAFTYAGLTVQDDDPAMPLNEFGKGLAKRAIDLWKLTRVGDSWYFALDDASYSGRLRRIIEVKNPKVMVRSGQQLTEADRLNGLEWQGWINLKYKAERKVVVIRTGVYERLRQYNEPPDNHWSEWMNRDSLVSTPITVRNKKFEIGKTEYSIPRCGSDFICPEAVPLSEIRKAGSGSK
jgi:hypothetical protein